LRYSTIRNRAAQKRLTRPRRRKHRTLRARACATFVARCLRSYHLGVASRERISVELDTEVVSRLRAQAVEANVSEGEIVERALQVADLRALVGQIRSRSDLDEEASMKLVREELKAARADARNRAA